MCNALLQISRGAAQAPIFWIICLFGQKFTRLNPPSNVQQSNIQRPIPYFCPDQLHTSMPANSIDLSELAQLRRNYALESLSEAGVLPDPLEQFALWFKEALNSQLTEPNAMTLATATRTGRPSARTVLLKGIDHQGFVFYTNYESRKGGELAENPQAALLFTWLELERQVRVEGTVEKVTREESLAYFQSRPKSSQIGAWASPQSRSIPDRGVLEKNVADLSQQHAAAETLPLPPFWGGFRLKPEVIEFWQGRESRLHDRIRYTRTENGWETDRLAP